MSPVAAGASPPAERASLPGHARDTAAAAAAAAVAAASVRLTVAFIAVKLNWAREAVRGKEKRKRVKREKCIFVSLGQCKHCTSQIPSHFLVLPRNPFLTMESPLKSDVTQRNHLAGQ